MQKSKVGKTANSPYQNSNFSFKGKNQQALVSNAFQKDPENVGNQEEQEAEKYVVVSPITILKQDSRQNTDR